MPPRTTGHPDVDRLLKADGGVLLQRRAAEVGIPAAAVRRLARTGILVPVAKGAFALGDALASSHPWVPFQLRSRAFTLSGAPDGHAVGASAQAVLGLPRLGPPPELPTVIRPGNPHRGHTATPWGRVRFGYLPTWHQRRSSGVRVADPVHTAIDVARHRSRVEGLMVADQVLHGGAHADQFAELAAHMANYPGIAEARWVIEHADGRAESPLESAGRYVLLSEGLPRPVVNPWILTRRGWRRVDLLLDEYGIALEANGALKYNNRADADQIVRAERVRDEDLHELDLDVLHFDWALVFGRPADFAAWIRRCIVRRAGRPALGGWQLASPFLAS